MQTRLIVSIDMVCVRTGSKQGESEIEMTFGASVEERCLISLIALIESFDKDLVVERRREQLVKNG